MGKGQSGREFIKLSQLYFNLVNGIVSTPGVDHGFVQVDDDGNDYGTPHTI
jgi:hypothetical protein